MSGLGCLQHGPEHSPHSDSMLGMSLLQCPAVVVRGHVNIARPKPLPFHPYSISSPYPHIFIAFVTGMRPNADAAFVSRSSPDAVVGLPPSPLHRAPAPPLTLLLSPPPLHCRVLPPIFLLLSHAVVVTAAAKYLVVSFHPRALPPLLLLHRRPPSGSSSPVVGVFYTGKI
jgi:hypothetical protein